jgi:hydrogenase maturation protease
MNVPPRIVVVGLGNDFRGDDACGLIIARKIKGMALDGVRTVVGLADGTDLFDLWDDSTTVFVVDCAHSGAAPGTVHRFEPLTEPFPEHLMNPFSTHSFSLARTLDLARALDSIPAHIIVYGIEGDSFGAGAEMSAAVRKSMDSVVTAIRDDISGVYQNVHSG